MCGKPIIVCEDTGIDKLVKEKDIGLVCEFTEQSLENVFIQVFTNESEYCKKVENTQKLYEQKYKWYVMIYTTI